MMRVCTPHCGLDPESGLGGEVYEREILRALAARGMVFDILLARHKRHPEEVRNWVVHRLRLGRGLRWPLAAVLLPPYIKRVHDLTGFDVLRAHSLRFIGPAALLARRRYRLDVPVVAHHHHLDGHWLEPLIEARVVRGADRVVVGSEFARRQAARAFGVSAERFSVVPYGVDRRFQPQPRAHALEQRLGLAGRAVALFLGSLQPRKNLFFLLDVWRDVARARPDATLVVAGSGRLRGRLERHAADLVRDRRVVFTGHVPEDDKVACYNAADLLIFPSAMEGFGFTVAEAMSCGLPVLVSDRGSLPELMADGEGGFLCDPQDRHGFVQKALLLLSDGALRRKLGAANRERVDRLFRWESCAAATERVYADVLAAWRRRASGRRAP